MPSFRWWLIQLALIQAQLFPGSAANNRPATNTRATSTLVVNCYNAQPEISFSGYSNTALETSYFKNNIIDPLDAMNVAKFVVAPMNECENYISAISYAYKDRPLTKKIMQIILGMKHDMTFSIDPSIDVQGYSLPFSGAVILKELNPLPPKKSPTLTEIVYNAGALTRHETRHTFERLFRERNTIKGHPKVHYKLTFESYDAFIEKINRIKVIDEKSEDGRISLTKEERKKLLKFKALANEGITEETKGFEQISLIISQTQVLERLMSVVKIQHKDNPGMIAEEMFAHIWHLFAEKHIQHFLPHFYQATEEMIASFEDEDIKLLDSPSQTKKELKNYTFEMLTEKQTKLKQKNIKNIKLMFEKLYIFYTKMEESIEPPNVSAANEVISFYEKPNINKIIDISGDENCVIARITLGLAYFIKEDSSAAFANFNKALKKGQEFFTDEDLHIFNKVSNQFNPPKPINCEHARNRIKALQEKQESKQLFGMDRKLAK